LYRRLEIRRQLPRCRKIEPARLLIEEPDPPRCEIEKPRDDLERLLERERQGSTLAKCLVDRFEDAGVVALGFR